MDLLPDQEQAAIAATAADVLAGHGYPARANELAAAGQWHDPRLWGTTTELGWLGLAVAPDDGGAGYGLAEQVLLYRELGRHLAVGPYLPAAVATVALAGTDLVADVVGGARVALAAAGPATGPVLVCDAAEADLVVQAGPEGTRVLDGSCLSAAPVATLDPTVACALASLPGEGANLVTVAGSRPWLVGMVLSAALLGGIAEAVARDSVAHASTRHQFGRAIGSFQAVKHRCADLAVRAEAAFRQVCWAALAVRDGHPDAARQAAAARAVATDAAHRGAADNVQIHGAMGFAAEHTAHLYVKRAHAWSWSGAAPRDARELLLAR